MMPVKTVRFSIVLLLLMSCVSKEEVKLTLKEDTVRQAFIDVSLAEQALAKANFSEKDSLRDLYRNQISKIHKTPFSEIEYNLSLVQKDVRLFKEFNEAYRDTLASLNKDKKKSDIKKAKEDRDKPKKN